MRLIGLCRIGSAVYRWVFVLLWVAGMAVPVSGWAASAYIPLTHPAYSLIESWGLRGVLPPHVVSVRPIRWETLAMLLMQARTSDRATRVQLKALAREAATHLGAPGSHLGVVTLSGNYARGNPLVFASVPATDGAPVPGYRQGRQDGDGWGIEAELRLENRYKNGLTMVLAPRWHGGQSDAGNPTLQQGYVAWDTGPLAWSVGRQPMLWGPARHGGFLLTDNAAPLPVVRTELKSPLSLGFPWGHWGRLDGSLFLGQLEESRQVSRPYLGGLRLTWQPTYHIAIAFSRTVMTGGAGQGGVSAGDVLTILTGKNLRGEADTSNSIAGIDWVMDVPLPGQARRFRLYGEYAGEDEANAWPTKPAVRLGVLLPGRQEGVTLRAEFAATDVFYDHQRWGHSVWYRHSIYRSGYTYRGQIIGDAMGPDARDARIWLSSGALRDASTLSLGWRVNRFSDPDKATRWQAAYLKRVSREGGGGWVFGVDVARIIDAAADTLPWQSLVTVSVEIPLAAR